MILYPALPADGHEWIASGYDCISALAAERCGFTSFLIGRKEFGLSLYGNAEDPVPVDELVQLAGNLRLTSPLTLYAEADAGMLSPRAAARLARAGISGFLLPVRGEKGLEASLRTAGMLTENGMRVILGVYGADPVFQAAAVGRMIRETALFCAVSAFPDPGFVPDRSRLILSRGAERPGDGEKFDPSAHGALFRYSMRESVRGMMLFGERTAQDRDTVFHDRHDFDGMLNGHDYHDVFDFGTRWLELERELSERGRRESV